MGQELPGRLDEGIVILIPDFRAMVLSESGDGELKCSVFHR